MTGRDPSRRADGDTSRQADRAAGTIPASRWLADNLVLLVRRLRRFNARQIALQERWLSGETGAWRGPR